MLRTLTLKSQLKFGKYSDYTVSQLIQIKKHLYLRWVYYNCSNISFMNDVLEQISIDYLIAKPGCDKHFFELEKLKYQAILGENKFIPNLTVKEASIFKAMGKRTIARRLVNLNHSTNITKGALQTKNQSRY